MDARSAERVGIAERHLQPHEPERPGHRGGERHRQRDLRHRRVQPAQLRGVEADRRLSRRRLSLGAPVTPSGVLSRAASVPHAARCTGRTCSIDKYSCTLHAMWGLRVRAGRASERVLDGMAGADFRARLGVSLTEALVEPTTDARRRRSQPASRPRPRCAGVRSSATRCASANRSSSASRCSRWAARSDGELGVARARRQPALRLQPRSHGEAPAAAQLDALGVLRRAQTGADRGPGVQAALTDVNNFTIGLRSDYVRVLATTSRRSGRPRAGPDAKRRRGAARHPERAVRLLPGERAQRAERDRLLEHPTGALGAGVRRRRPQEYGLVPDGVSSVSVSLGSWTKSVAVSDNFFDVTVPAGRRERRRASRARRRSPSRAADQPRARGEDPQLDVWRRTRRVPWTDG